VLVLPSDYEPWALVINEAAAAGLAIISSSVVGAAAEILRDGVNGRSFAPGDKDALAVAMLEVTDQSTLLKMKSASPGMLADWRRRGDPVQGLREALLSVDILK
jgi:glycosyltransferase involved in cell wall biosynthesis